MGLKKPVQGGDNLDSDNGNLNLGYDITTPIPNVKTLDITGSGVITGLTNYSNSSVNIYMVIDGVTYPSTNYKSFTKFSSKDIFVPFKSSFQLFVTSQYINTSYLLD